MCGIVGWLAPGRERDCARRSAPSATAAPTRKESRTAPAGPWASAGSPSSTSPPATSRSPTRTRRSGSSATARSTTTTPLRRDLMSARPRLPHGSDVEVIVHLYEEYGERLRRSPAGDVRPVPGHAGRLFRCPRPARHQAALLERTNATACTSPPRSAPSSSCRACRGRRPTTRASPTTSSFRYVPEPHTAFVGIDRFRRRADHDASTPPARSSRATGSSKPQPPFQGTFEDAVAECEDRLDRSSSMHLMSERPVGVFLSGGPRFVGAVGAGRPPVDASHRRADGLVPGQRPR